MQEEQDPLLKKIKTRNWLALGVATLASLIFWSLPVTLGVFLGGCICSFNFHWMYRDARRALQNSPDKGPRQMVLRFYLRLVITGMVILLVITQTPANVIALVVGLSIVVVTVVLTVLLETQKKPPQEVK